MATTTYAQYPTPPPTGSPKDHDNHQYRPYSPAAQHRRPVAESATYFNPAVSFSAPGSPSQVHSRWDTPSKTAAAAGNPQQPFYTRAQPSQYDYLPPRRKSSPIQSQQQQKPYDQDTYYNPSESSSTIRPLPPRRRSSPGVSPNTNTNNTTTSHSPHRRRSPHLPPRPLHFSPINPIPTPYNASRPLPRPGLLKRMMNKLRSWARGFIRWCRANPIKAGLLTVIPVLAGAAVFSVFTSAAKVLGSAGILLMEGMGGGRTPGHWKGEEVKEMAREKIREVKDNVRGARDDAKEAAEAQAAEWGYGIDDFQGIGGCKGGPIEGFLKVMQMMVNHYCKLTPSAVPRALSILLELYFLDQIKKQGGI